MRHSAFVKTLAVILAVASVVCLIGSGFFVLFNISYGLYTGDPAELQAEEVEWHSQNYAHAVAEQFAYETSDIPKEIWRNYFGWDDMAGTYWPDVDYILVDGDGNSVELNEYTDYAYEKMVNVSLTLGHVVQVGENWEYYPEYALEDAYGYGETNVTLPVEIPQMPDNGAVEENTAPTAAPIDTGVEDDGWYDEYSTNSGNIYRIYRDEEPTEYNVVLFYTQEEYDAVAGRNYCTTPLGRLIYHQRYNAMIAVLVSAAVLILMMTYLACAAGRKPGSEEVKPAGLNKLPLDLYTFLACFLGFWLVWLLLDSVGNALVSQNSLRSEAFWVLTLTAVGLSAAIGLICVLCWCALCAQVKVGDGFWWRNTIIGRFGKGVWMFIKRCVRKLLSVITGVGGKVGDKMPTITELLRDFNDKLPLMWQWLTASMVMFALVAILGAMTWHGFGMFLYAILMALCIAAVVYGARAFGQLRDAAKRMSQGNLDVKIDPDTLEGCFKDFAGDLNALSDACIHAAREQLKSERMKTELITNVSHDIKTPLTSIINYVDLLQKAQTEEERKQYLEVLERQSLRLKKLIEDLMEMSKVSSGNVAMELAPTDVVESVNQALGEYADRFEALRLTVLFRKPEESVMAVCDGKLLWRVMSNVLTNVVKYAMPGTRVYLDLTVTEFKAQLSVKNISREELNISAEELMERFVRGDESRNTEGNGLGLNIAKSLMEVQGGSLDLTVDGDLFKVALTLPRAVCAGISCES